MIVLQILMQNWKDLKMLECIKSKYGKFKVNGCCDSGCRLRMAGKRGYIILKGEKLYKNSKKMCDCVIFREDRTIILVELKNSIRHYSDFNEKFSNAGEKALKISNSCKQKFNIAGIVILKKKGVSKAIFRIIEYETRPIISGKRPKVFYGNCGCNLDEILKE